MAAHGNGGGTLIGIELALVNDMMGQYMYIFILIILIAFCFGIIANQHHFYHFGFGGCNWHFIGDLPRTESIETEPCRGNADGLICDFVSS